MDIKFGVRIEINLLEQSTYVKVSENDIEGNEKSNNPEKLTGNKNFHGISDESMG